MDEHTVENLFADRPDALRLFTEFAPRIEAMGGIAVVVTKSQVSFGADRKFAWLWPIPRSRKVPEDVLMLTLDMRTPVADPLIRSVEETYPGKWTHQIRVADESVIGTCQLTFGPGNLPNWRLLTSCLPTRSRATRLERRSR